jgi:hypothetical protein
MKEQQELVEPVCRWQPCLAAKWLKTVSLRTNSCRRRRHRRLARKNACSSSSKKYLFVRHVV